MTVAIMLWFCFFFQKKQTKTKKTIISQDIEVFNISACLSPQDISSPPQRPLDTESFLKPPQADRSTSATSVTSEQSRSEQVIITLFGYIEALAISIQESSFISWLGFDVSHTNSKQVEKCVCDGQSACHMKCQITHSFIHS